MISRLINWLLMWEIRRSIRSDEKRKRREKAAAAIVLACALSAIAGCISAPRTGGGGWNGPLVDPDGNPINPPTYEVRP